jgi:hypothetical protein
MDQRSRCTEPFGQLAWTAFALGLCALPARAELSITGSGFLGADEWGYRQEEYGLDLAHEAETSGQLLALRFYRYALDDELEGVLPFSGHEPAARLRAHALLDDALWLLAGTGLQGTLDFDGLTGELIAAYAIAAGDHVLTPRIELAREPLAASPLPLSLGLHSHRVQGALAWKSAGLVAEGGARIDLWEGDTVPDRARNSARDRIQPNRITTGYGYVITESESWLDAGLAAKVSAAERNTLLPTQLVPERRYTWYPASVPPLAFETSAIVRVQSKRDEPLEVKLQLGLPLVSRELREWEGVRVASWGTAPYEAAFDAKWRARGDTSLLLQAKLFIKPWESWDAIGDGAYRYASVRVALEHRI